ncbi:PASTA domain-containing protein [Glycomyces sp. NPDC047010]|uniref:PASTA domain-containing protein n=1 Tax=Glycomyces sp. NPDC047010 TaxID=3155023 RepID=UPI0033C8EC6C
MILGWVVITVSVVLAVGAVLVARSALRQRTRQWPAFPRLRLPQWRRLDSTERPQAVLLLAMVAVCGLSLLPWDRLGDPAYDPGSDTTTRYDPTGGIPTMEDPESLTEPETISPVPTSPSATPSGYVVVPEVIGASVTDAAAALTAAGFTDVEYVASVPGSEPGAEPCQVFDVNPSAGTARPPGMTVRIYYVSAESPESCV